MEKDERYACETELAEKDLIQDIKNILNSDIYKNKVRYKRICQKKNG